MPLSETLVKRIQHAVTDVALGNELVNAINSAEADTLQSLLVIGGLITATAVSQTTDFGSLRVGDRVLMFAPAAGNAQSIGPIVTAGTLGVAAVVGNVYLVLRAPVAAAASTTKL